MFEKEIEILRSKDPILKKIIEKIGECNLELEPKPFPALVEAILYQQLSMKAAGTIVRRFKALYPNHIFPTPKDILDTPDEKLRGCGISGPKIKYIKDLSQKFKDEVIVPSKFSEISDEQIIDELIQVKGIGRWTAEMFLIFSLGRPNVLPVDDLGFRKAVYQYYGFDDLPSKDEIQKVAKKWEPYCTIATWYLWRSLDKEPLKK